MKNLTMTLVLLALLPLSGCKVNPATGKSQLLFLSADAVAAMGIEAKPQLVEEYGGEVASAELRSYVAGVGNTLVEQVEDVYRDLPWEFTVLDSDVINAFALPGGKVFITEALLARFENEGQVAGVLGHEIGHVTGKHVDERMSHAMAIQFGTAALGLMTESSLIQGGVGYLSQGYVLKFGRDQESQADVLGIRYMTQAMYDPLGMAQVMEVLAAANTGQRSPEFLSTHPYPETRLETIGRLRDGDYAFTKNNPKYGLYPGRFNAYARPYLPTVTAMAEPFHWCAVCAGEHEAGVPVAKAEPVEEIDHMTE